MIFTHAVFEKFQSQVTVARDHCFVQNITENEETKIVTISTLSGKEQWPISTSQTYLVHAHVNYLGHMAFHAIISFTCSELRD
jgi:hypothetical protein